MRRRHKHCVSAEHEEFALGEVQHPHHSEDDGKAEGKQHKRGDGEQNAKRRHRDLVHAAQALRVRDRRRHGRPSELRRVLRMLVGLSDKVADLLRVRRFDILDRLEDREALLAVDLGQMHGMRDVIILRIELYCALWRVEG